MTEVKRVLIIRFSSLGDVVLATAVIEAIRNSCPESIIHVLTRKQYEQVFGGDPRIKQLFGIDDSESPFETVKRIGLQHYDTVIDLQGNLRSFIVRKLISASEKRVVNKHSWGRRVMIASRNLIRFKNDVLGNYFATVQTMGNDERTLPRIIPSDESSENAKKLFLTVRPTDTTRVIAIAPGSKHDTKRWDEVSFAQLADAFADRGDVPLFIGDSSDQAVIGRIQEHMAHSAQSYAGTLNLGDTIGLISQCQGMVANDSGPMHLAGALGIPFVTIFGPTHPDLGFFPDYTNGILLHTNEPCSPCSLHGKTPCRKPSRRCMNGITPAIVLEAIDRLLKFSAM